MLDPGRKPAGLGRVITCPGERSLLILSLSILTAPLFPSPSATAEHQLESVSSTGAGKSPQLKGSLRENRNTLLIERTADIRSSPLSTPDNGRLISVYLYTLASTSRCSRKGSALIYAVYIHQARAKPISHCQNGACGILSPQGPVTEQVLFHYPLSGQSLILPLCSWVMLFISVVCALGFHISGSLCQDLNPFEPEFGHYHVVCIKDCRATFPPFLFSFFFFWIQIAEPYLSTVFFC